MPRVVTVQGADQAKVSEQSVPPENLIRIYADSERDIIEEIHRAFGQNGTEVRKVFWCESSLKQDAYNPEIEAKKRWKESGGKYGTPYSSCSIAKINPAESGTSNTKPKTSPLYDYRYNINEAKKLYDARGFRPWKNCSISLGYIK